MPPVLLSPEKVSSSPNGQEKLRDIPSTQQLSPFLYTGQLCAHSAGQ